jgi:hypothetical protein
MKLARLSALRTGRFTPQELTLLLISVRSSADPKSIISMKNLKQPIGIEPATFRFVAYCPDELGHRVPQY